ncbi:MAG: hypothetical protein ABF335_13325 [Alphaproteobacteria bacterium]
MVKVRGDHVTLDLFGDAEPVAINHTFKHDDPKVKSWSMRGRIARGVAVTLEECALSRAEIAAQMSEFLGADVSEHMLNKYASVSAQEKTISLDRAVALIAVCGDARFLGAELERIGKAIIDARYLAAVEAAYYGQIADEAASKRQAALRDLRKGGGWK